MVEREGNSSQSSQIELSPEIQKTWAQIEKLNAALIGGNSQIVQEAATALNIDPNEITPVDKKQ